MGLTFNLGRDSAALTSDASLNVGIGGSPSGSYKLEVTGTSNFTGVLRVGAATGFAVGSIAGYRRIEYTGTTFSMLTNADGYAGLSAGAATFSSSVTATGLSLITAGSTSALIQGTGTNVYSSLSFQNTTTGYGYDIGFGGSASIAPNSFYIYGGSSASVKFLIDSAGNVGIGTSSPLALTAFTSLEVKGSNAGLVGVSSSGGAAFGRMYASGNAITIGTSTSSTLVFDTNDTERMRISSTGLVTVYGTGLASNLEGIYFKRTSTLDQGGFISGSGGVLNLYATNAYSSLYGTMVFGRYNGTTTVESMRINSDGYLGIGTTNPTFKLVVAQDITNDTGDINVGQFMVCGATTNNKRLVIGYDTNGNGYGYIESAYYNSVWTYTCLQPTAGNVMIGTATDLGYKLGVNGTAAKPGGGSWADSSDARLKKDIKTIENALDKINKLNPVNFEWINPEEHHNQSNVSGFIAQEMKEVFPDFINEANPIGKDKDIVGENEKIYALTLSFKFDAYLVKSIQELSAQNQDLKSRLDKAGL
jgi:hypothetical protein